jgi:4-hydroxybenzoate polyprenyltransferase
MEEYKEMEKQWWVDWEKIVDCIMYIQMVVVLLACACGAILSNLKMYNHLITLLIVFIIVEIGVYMLNSKWCNTLSKRTDELSKMLD